MQQHDSTISFYDEHADTFIANTLEVDMKKLYSHFLPLLPKKAHILDAGCGSGRDSRYFLKNGYQLTAVDGSAELVKSASAFIGQPVTHCLFQEIQTDSPFDAIWACASLLHVPSNQLPKVFLHLAKQIKPQGIFYCSFKLGDDDTEREGRYFTNANEARLRKFISKAPLTIEKIWLTDDVRPARKGEQWLNAILRKDNE